MRDPVAGAGPSVTWHPLALPRALGDVAGTWGAVCCPGLRASPLTLGSPNGHRALLESGGGREVAGPGTWALCPSRREEPLPQDEEPRCWGVVAGRGGGFPAESREPAPLPHHGVTACRIVRRSHVVDDMGRVTGDAGRVTARGRLGHPANVGELGPGGLRGGPPVTPGVTACSREEQGVSRAFYSVAFPHTVLTSEATGMRQGQSGRLPPRRARPPLSQVSCACGHQAGGHPTPPPEACEEPPHWGPVASGPCPSRPRAGQ